MTLLPDPRIPVPPPLGYRWHMQPSMFTGGLVDLHLDPLPGWVDGIPHISGDNTARQARKILKALERKNGGPFPPRPCVGTPIAKERRIRRVSKCIVRKHYEDEAKKAQWTAVIDDFQHSDIRDDYRA